MVLGLVEFTAMSGIPEKRVIVALSGGVDSAVAALCLLRAGYRVEAMHMTNWDDANEYCTAGTDLADARRVCADLRIHLHEISFAREYREAVFADFFGDDPIAARLAPLVVRVDHVGAIAPFGATIADAESALLSSPFRHGSRRFRSRILAADLSERLGHPVAADVMEARTDGASEPRLGFEWFVTDLPGHELEGLIREELGCHVALRLSPGVRSRDVHRILGEPTGGSGATVALPMRTNDEIGIRLLYLDRPAEGGRVRRLELLDDA